MESGPVQTDEVRMPKELAHEFHGVPRPPQVRKRRLVHDMAAFRKALPQTPEVHVRTVRPLQDPHELPGAQPSFSDSSFEHSGAKFVNSTTHSRYSFIAISAFRVRV